LKAPVFNPWNLTKRHLLVFKMYRFHIQRVVPLRSGSYICHVKWGRGGLGGRLITCAYDGAVGLYTRCI
jgi:hypothetical protein